MEQHHETKSSIYEQIKAEVHQARWDAFHFGYAAAEYNKEDAPEFIDKILRDNPHKDFAIAGMYSYIHHYEPEMAFNKTLEAQEL